MEENKSFFDFDGTLIRINSFPYWILFVIGYSILSLNFSLVIKVSNLLIQRKIKKNISHREFKKKLIQLPIYDDCNQKFAKFISIFVRKKLSDELKKLYEQKHLIVISSAAPENYLKYSIEKIFPPIQYELTIIGSKLTFDGKLNDNYKEEKLKNLYKCNFLNKQEFLKNIYTDSWDDMSLALQSEKLILVSPTKKTKNLYLKDAALAPKTKLF